MKLTKLLYSALVASTLFSASSAFAGIFGFETDRGSSYAFFDKFSGTNVSSIAPELFDTGEGSATSGPAFTGLNLKTEAGLWDTESSSFITAGGSAAGNGDRLYLAVMQDPLAARLTITGTLTQATETLSLNIKLSRPDQDKWSEVFTSAGLQVNGSGGYTEGSVGVGATSGLGSIGTGERANPLGIIYYIWEGANLQAGDTFEFVLFSPNSHHASIDAFQIVDAIPEPSTYALLGAGAMGLLALRRRKA